MGTAFHSSSQCADTLLVLPHLLGRTVSWRLCCGYALATFPEWRFRFAGTIGTCRQRWIVERYAAQFIGRPAKHIHWIIFDVEFGFARDDQPTAILIKWWQRSMEQWWTWLERWWWFRRR